MPTSLVTSEREVNTISGSFKLCFIRPNKWFEHIWPLRCERYTPPVRGMVYPVEPQSQKPINDDEASIKDRNLEVMCPFMDT
jgi:hypothetical protein